MKQIIKQNDETNDKQPHTTDMPDVENEKFAEQRNTRIKNINFRLIA